MAPGRSVRHHCWLKSLAGSIREARVRDFVDNPRCLVVPGRARIRYLWVQGDFGLGTKAWFLRTL